jgi:hypothetical protein
MTEGAWVGRQIFFILALEFLDKMVDETVVKILSTQVSVTSSGFDLKDTISNGWEGNINGPPSEIEDENVTLAADLLIETVGNGGSRRLVDDTEDIHA